MDSDINFSGLITILKGLAAEYGHRVIVTPHPADRNGPEEKKALFCLTGMGFISRSG